jgi:hypothetical protein
MQDSISFLKLLKYGAMLLGALMVAGIAGLMLISWDKDEDITGIVAPALLVTFLSVVVAIVAAVLQKRLQKAIEK